jgi:molybdenum cofactor guanylyltransferase
MTYPGCYYLGMVRRAGFVLVGGHSSRMGSDKALLPMPEGTLLQHIAAKAAVAAGNVALVGNPERYGGLGFECVQDLVPNRGPLAGIYTALATRRGEYNLILACDMPNLEQHLLGDLFDVAASVQSRCVVIKDAGGRIHPLCAVYRQDCLEIVEKAIIEGRLRLMHLLNELGATHIPINGTVSNCNTPAEWSAVAHT